ncbi:MAG: hypothetical protein M1834_001184 [Cirrosporium novae-zelandiae]|nr:MAG: hypothetical protein M1834_001184 [Cirrosporium novae-zelandiae]
MCLGELKTFTTSLLVNQRPTSDIIDGPSNITRTHPQNGKRSASPPRDVRVRSRALLSPPRQGPLPAPRLAGLQRKGAGEGEKIEVAVKGARRGWWWRWYSTDPRGRVDQVWVGADEEERG